MKIDHSYDFKQIINARGVFTPLGVSRSSPETCAAVTYALSNFFDMAELQDRAGAALATYSGGGAGTITHCVSAAITLSVAGLYAGTDPRKIAALPHMGDPLPQIVIQAGHLVDYGHPLEQDIRLAGARVRPAGTDARCSPEDLEQALSLPDTLGLLLVESRLARGEMVDPVTAIALAKKHSCPVILDAAAQDFRLRELVGLGAELTLFSGQKYLSGPTAGLVIGAPDRVAAVRAQEKGIGRSMKASKEAILGTLAALAERSELDLAAWETGKLGESREFADRLNRIPGISTTLVPDPTQGPFSRIHARFDEKAVPSATEIAGQLRNGDPAIYVFENEIDSGILIFEIMALTDSEQSAIIRRLQELCDVDPG